MTDEYTSEELLERALGLLSAQYDIDLDSFFLIVTKDAKADEEIPGTQIVVGELETRAVLTFIIHAIQQLSAVNGVAPYVFISRHILGHFISEERRAVNATLEEDVLLTDPVRLGLEDEEAEAHRTNMLIYDRSMLDTKN